MRRAPLVGLQIFEDFVVNVIHYGYRQGVRISLLEPRMGIGYDRRTTDFGACLPRR